MKQEKLIPDMHPKITKRKKNSYKSGRKKQNKTHNGQMTKRTVLKRISIWLKNNENELNY